MSTKVYVLAAGTFAVLVAGLSFYRLHRSRERKKRLSQTDDNEQQDSLFMEDRILYTNQVSDPEHFLLKAKNAKFDKNIASISYDIILNLNKGTTYEGVVKIKLSFQKRHPHRDDFIIDFNGKSILFMAVNDRKIEQQQVIFRSHEIVIKGSWLQKDQNSIEIIFSNRYSFMSDGLTAYFLLDENNKYSLKGQTIYSRNGSYQVAKLFPCLNILNPCQVKLQLLQPQGFDTFSNTPKSLLRFCSTQDYPQYPFFFQTQPTKLNRSFKLHTSFADSNSQFREHEDIVKSNTQFYDSNLSSIHGFFLFCSYINEVRPIVHKQYSNDILIRYFVKENSIEKAQNYINLLHYQIMEINARLERYSTEESIELRTSHKIDIFFINDEVAEGNFYMGAIYLYEKTLEKSYVDMRIFYLIARAIVGMSLLQKQQFEMLNLAGKIKLNQLTAEIFPQCVDLLTAKQAQYSHIKSKVNSINSSPVGENRFLLQEYYEKECRFLVWTLDESKMTKNVKEVMRCLKESERQPFWAHFIGCYQLIEPTVSEVIIKLAIKKKGIPKDETSLNYLKQNLTRSQNYLKLFTNEEIQSDLKKFIELNSHGLEKRIPFIKIKEKYKKLINEKIENYLSIKSNRLEARDLYEQFKRYNENRNFHHISVLGKEIKRVGLLASESIKEERRDLECGLMGWKLLRKLAIHPVQEETYRLIEQFQQKQNAHQ